MTAPVRPNDYAAYPDARGRFGDYGGRYVPETLMPLVHDLDAAFRAAKADAAFQGELKSFLTHYVGRESPARTREIAVRSGVGIIKALPVAEASDLDAAASYEPVVEHLMFDAKPPKDAALPGGAGRAFDWSLMAGRSFRRPWFLAGGLDPWNVAEAAQVSGAPLVDVSSGVERGPGLKDPALITAFLDAVRRA